MRSSKKLESAKYVSSIFSCLSNPNRLLITCFLIKGEKSVGEIVNEIGTTKGNISQHLRILELNGILQSRKNGNRIYYSIKDERVKKIVYYVKKLYCADIKFS